MLGESASLLAREGAKKVKIADPTSVLSSCIEDTAAKLAGRRGHEYADLHLEGLGARAVLEERQFSRDSHVVSVVVMSGACGGGLRELCTEMTRQMARQTLLATAAVTAACQRDRGHDAIYGSIITP